jgi:hypothetical protein
MLFALTLQGPLEEVAEMNLHRTLAYANEMFLQGAREPTMQAFQALTALAAPLRLCALQSNGTVYSINTAAATSIAGQLGMRQTQNGIMTAGTSFGTPVFQGEQADLSCQLMDELLDLSLADQDHWLLLHGSLQRPVAHLPRAKCGPRSAAGTAGMECAGIEYRQGG